MFEPEHVDFEMTLLWHRGDDLASALARLHVIVPDPTAGRAPRDAMLPQFDGLDRWIPKSCREDMALAVNNQIVEIERLTFPNVETDDPVALEHLYDRWKDSSPLFRAAQVVLGFAVQRGIEPRSVWLHGQRIDRRTTPYYADFQLRYFRAVPRYLAEEATVEWLAVIRPTRYQPLEALRITPRDRTGLAQAEWS